MLSLLEGRSPRALSRPPGGVPPAGAALLGRRFAQEQGLWPRRVCACLARPDTDPRHSLFTPLQKRKRIQEDIEAAAEAAVATKGGGGSASGGSGGGGSSSSDGSGSSGGDSDGGSDGGRRSSKVGQPACFCVCVHVGSLGG